MAPRRVLGLAASHNGATCLLDEAGGAIAIQEERLTREKRAELHAGEAFLGLDYVLDAAGVDVGALDLVAVAALHGVRRPEDDLDRHPRLGSVPRLVVSHHRAHAISAYATSGFEDAAVLVVDGMGSAIGDLPADEHAALPPGASGRESVSLYEIRRGQVRALEKQLAPPWDPTTDPVETAMLPFTSVGMMVQSVAQQLFGHWSHAGKVMGLAPFGRRRWPTGAFVRLDDDGLRFDGARVRASFPERGPTWPRAGDLAADLACSVQGAVEDTMLHLAARLRARTDCRDLCLAGGVALNSVANERIIRSRLFDRVFIVPAAEDCGTALGAAWAGLWALDGPRPGVALTRDALGRAYDDAEIRAALAAAELPAGARVEPLALDRVADALASGAVVGWHQGRSELGPRALGQRSILLDPRRPDGQDHLNRRVKHREPFRPFAPAVLAEHACDWFDLPDHAPASPFMLRVVPARPERLAQIPAVVHIDGTARLQTVPAEPTPFRALLEAFHAATAVPLVLDTSFNVAGEPLVETPADALRCFASTGIDLCVVGGWVVSRGDG